MNKFYVGVDLGGTNIKIGLVDEAGSLMLKQEGPTESEGGAEAVVGKIAQMARGIVADAGKSWEEVAGIGIGVPGFTELSTGLVRLAPNLGWHNVPAKQWLTELLSKPIFLENDANVAALGEAWSGSGKGIDELVCVTLGTGVGGGLILRGEIYQGARGTAGEIGHMPMIIGEKAVQCGCGKWGCLETVASATGMVESAKILLETGMPSMLAEAAHVSTKELFRAAEQGDRLALQVVEDAMDVLGRALASMAVMLNLERFVIGGGVSRAGETLFKPLREAFVKYTPAVAAERVDIVAASLGNDAGLIGAAGLVARSMK